MIDTDAEAARLKRLAHAVRTMDQRTRDIFLMHRIDDLDYPAIAVRLRIGVDAVERGVAAGAGGSGYDPGAPHCSNR
jgi:RNA polymerase sigma-70 factor (ECF subfamily)